MEDRQRGCSFAGLEWDGARLTGTGQRARDTQSCLSWPGDSPLGSSEPNSALETLALCPVFLPQGTRQFIHPKPLSRARRRCSLPFSRCLSELQAPQTVMCLGDGVRTLLNPDSCYKVQRLLHPPTLCSLTSGSSSFRRSRPL